MTEALGLCLICDNLLDYLKTLPWCKQNDQILIAVHKITPEIIVAFSDHDAKVLPGGTSIKLNKSWLAHLQEQNEESNPLPVLLVWRADGIELSYRRHKSWDFPYDGWKDPIAEAWEREVVLLPQKHSAKFQQFHQELLKTATVCPTAIPPQ